MDSDGDDLSHKPWVSALNEYANAEPTPEESKALLTELYRSTDRASVVLFGSLVERSIERLLRNRMRKHRSTDAIFDFNGAAGSFSTKISLAYAFELFGTKTRDDLNLIRNLRNKFAHSRRPIRFSNPAVKEFCLHLQYPDLPTVSLFFLTDVPKTMKDGVPDLSDPRTRLRTH